MKKNNHWWTQNKITVIFFSLIVIVTVVIISPLIRSNYVADNIPALMHSYNFETYWANLGPDLISAVEGGRVHLAPYLTGVLVNSWNVGILPVEKSLTFFFTFLTIALFAVLLKQLDTKGNWLWGALIFLPLLFQIRNYHDPFIVYFGAFQMFMALFLAAAIFLVKYLKTNRIAAAIWFLVFFFLVTNNHEANLMFYPALLVIFWLVTGKFWTKKIWPLLAGIPIIIFAYFTAPILQFILGLPAQTFEYSGTTIAFSITAVVKTWLVQAAAALPLNYFFGRVGQESLSYYPHLFLDHLPILLFGLVIFGVIFYLFYTQFDGQNQKINWQKFGLIILLGLSLWLAPALPVALVGKYQHDLTILFGMKSGLAYLMIYYQYFGVAILLASLFYLILNKIKCKKIFLILLTIICAVIFYLGYTVNVATVKQVDKGYDEQKFLVDQAKKTTFFNQLNGKTINLFTNHRDTNYYVVDDHNSYLMFALQRSLTNNVQLAGYCVANQYYSLTDQPTMITNCQQLLNSTTSNYFFYFDQVDEYSGYIILAPVTGFYQTIPTGNSVQIFYYSAYLNDNFPGGIMPKLRRDLWTTYYTVENGQPALQENRQWLVRDRETNSTIVTIESEQPILLDSIVPALIQADRESLNLIEPEN